MSAEFNIKEVSINYEKLIYTVSHKFSPEILTLCRVNPLGSFRKDQNDIVTKLNKTVLWKNF